ncbi:UNVERIFIED_CONTAM: hypothetical protein RMT77_016422 [Armadillidium vulgare]
MSGNTSSQGSTKEYIVRVPKTGKKHYHMMRFNADLGTDYFKTWTQCKMERENNLKEYKMEEETPKFGAGSEFGREQREEARRKRYGINVKKYRSEDQPWLLSLGGKNGKKYKGIREGGVADNVSWYVFMQGKDGAFEAYPVDEWYNFQPIQRYKALSAEEAEEEFVRRDKIMNYFQVMYEKKFRKENAEPDEDEGKKKGPKKSLMLSEMDDWVSDDDDEDEEEKNEDEDDSDDDGKKKKKKRGGNKKKQTGGKKKKKEGGESDNSCEEESDEYNEGAEHDYISSDSSDSDQENEEIVAKELAGVEEGDALKKLLASDEEDEEENEDKDKDEEEENKEEEGEEKEKKKKKKKKSDKKSDKDSEESSFSSSDESKRKKDGSKGHEKKTAVSELKRKVKENPHEMVQDSKRIKLDPSVPSGSNAGASGSADSMEEAIRRYLMRKPMTTTELLKNFKKKKDMSSEQLVTTIAQILKRVNPVKRMIKGKMYLSLKAS